MKQAFPRHPELQESSLQWLARTGLSEGVLNKGKGEHDPFLTLISGWVSVATSMESRRPKPATLFCGFIHYDTLQPPSQALPVLFGVGTTHRALHFICCPDTSDVFVKPRQRNKLGDNSHCREHKRKLLKNSAVLKPIRFSILPKGM